MTQKQRLILGSLVLMMVYLIFRISTEEYARFEDIKQSELQAAINDGLTTDIADLQKKLIASSTVAQKIYQRRISGNMRFSSEKAYKLVSVAPENEVLDINSIFLGEFSGIETVINDPDEFLTNSEKWWKILFQRPKD